MADLIDRQAAIDAIEFGITYAKAINKETGEVKELFQASNDELRKAEDRIKQLPSAQPNLQPTCNQLATDCISRQAAIDALAKNMPSLTTPDGCGEFDHDIQVIDEAYVDCMQIIHELPSAQQERPKGEWVLQSDDYHEYYECDQCGMAVGLDDVRNFCCNCGADMRGE